MKTLFFDIDGTLHKEDILFEFIVFLYRKHWLKTLLFLPLIVPGIILWKLGDNSNLGMNMLYFIACFGLNEKRYCETVAEFSQQFKTTYTPFAQVQAKLNHSDRIFLISGSPVDLIQAVYPDLIQQENVWLIGSISQTKWGSHYIRERCYAEQKKVMLDRQFPNTQFDEGYSDSLKDLPILALCKQAFRVNKNGIIMNMLNENKERNISDKIIINESILKDGDIILTSEKSFRSNVIKYATKSNYSHAIMMINKTAYIHAISSGIQSGNIQRLMFNNENEFCILRLKDYDKQQCKIRNACNFMIGEMDRYYSIFNAMLAPLHISFPLGNNDIGRYCSQLIALAYEKSEIPLLDKSNCTPQDLFTSDKLEHIKIQTQKISEMNSLKKEELQFDDPIIAHDNMRRKAIKIIQSNNKFKKCCTLSEIESVLENNPEHDQFIVDSINKVGYFNHYVTLKKLYEYRYNSYSQFKEKIKYYNDLDHKILVESLLSLSENQIKKYNRELDDWIRKNEMCQLKFYQLNIDLYRNLIWMYSILKHHCKKYNKES